MTDPSALAGAAVIVVGAVAGATVAIMKQQTAGKLEILKLTKEAAAANAQQGQTVADIKTKVEVVEHQTNSINSAQQTTIMQQEVQIKQLQEAIGRMEKIATVLAAAPPAERRGAPVAEAIEVIKNGVQGEGK